MYAYRHIAYNNVTKCTHIFTFTRTEHTEILRTLKQINESEAMRFVNMFEMLGERERERGKRQRKIKNNAHNEWYRWLSWFFLLFCPVIPCACSFFLFFSLLF